jgi:hypothetical protein
LREIVPVIGEVRVELVPLIGSIEGYDLLLDVLRDVIALGGGQGE